MTNTLSVFVAGATGNQGGALSRRLLENGHEVRAFVRNLDSPAASELQKLGAKLAKGDFGEPDSIERAARGADAAFIMATPFEVGVTAEAEQGIAAADAVEAAGVKHLVYSSVSGADDETGIPHFESKHRVERHIEGLGVTYTIVAPVYFMDNLLAPWNLSQLMEGVVSLALPKDRKLQQIPVEDVAAFTALVIERPEEFAGKRVDIASDELSGEEMARALSDVLGREVEYRATPVEMTRQMMGEDMALMMEWFDRVGYGANIEALRRDYPEVGWHTFEEWAASRNLQKVG
jgi:uncharacterized protein YbjT (DUF2867 family)